VHVLSSTYVHTTRGRVAHHARMRTPVAVLPSSSCFADIHLRLCLPLCIKTPCARATVCFSSYVLLSCATCWFKSISKLQRLLRRDVETGDDKIPPISRATQCTGSAPLMPIPAICAVHKMCALRAAMLSVRLSTKVGRRLSINAHRCRRLIVQVSSLSVNESLANFYSGRRQLQVAAREAAGTSIMSVVVLATQGWLASLNLSTKRDRISGNKCPNQRLLLNTLSRKVLIRLLESCTLIGFRQGSAELLKIT
jgi:hypothetical protein